MQTEATGTYRSVYKTWYRGRRYITEDPATAASQNAAGTYQCNAQINASYNDLFYNCYIIKDESSKYFMLYFLMLSKKGFVAGEKYI
jgi:hypothetical protein